MNMEPLLAWTIGAPFVIWMMVVASRMAERRNRRRRVWALAVMLLTPLLFILWALPVRPSREEVEP